MRTLDLHNILHQKNTSQNIQKILKYIKKGKGKMMTMLSTTHNLSEPRWRGAAWTTCAADEGIFPLHSSSTVSPKHYYKSKMVRNNLYHQIWVRGLARVPYAPSTKAPAGCLLPPCTAQTPDLPKPHRKFHHGHENGGT